MINNSFFTYAVITTKQIDEVISTHKKRPIKERHNEWLKDLESERKAGITSLDICEVKVLHSVDDIPTFYKSRLNEYLSIDLNATEKYFIEGSIKDCENLLEKINIIINEYKVKQKVIFDGIDELVELKKERTLLSRYLEFLIIPM